MAVQAPRSGAVYSFAIRSGGVMERGHRVRRLAALLLVASLAAPSGALADDLVGGDDWYGSVYGVLGVPNADASDQKLGGGVAASAGFRFNRWLAAEVGGEWAPHFSYDRGSGPVSCPGPSGDESNYFNAWSVTAGGRVYLTESLVQPFLLAHGGYMQTRDRGGGKACSRDGFVTRLGGGVEVFVSNDFAVSLLGAYVMPVTGGARDHDYVSIGLGLTWY
jgi:hypothetical protein